MALSVTVGTGVTPRGSDVIIPMANAGIGDIVFAKGNPRDPSNLLVVGRGTNSTTSATLNGTTYYRYGVIYGFVAGMAMIVSEVADSNTKQWSTNSSCSIGPAVGANTVLMRNGNRAPYYAAMNLAETYARRTNYGGTSPHPTSAWTAGGLMSYDTFAGSSGAAARNMYGEGLAGYYAYLSQVLRVNGAPGSPFGASWTDGTYGKVKVHEAGKVMTQLLHASSASAYPAANYCATYTVANVGDAAGNWWLPSMFELGELMIDDHLGKVNEGLINDLGTAVHRWSSIRHDSTDAWHYSAYGMSSHHGFSYSFTARPVSLLKLK